MSKENKYLIFCMEAYKSAKKLTGAEVAELFSKYSVYEYIIGCYDALHTTSTNYMINDIDMYIGKTDKSCI